MSANAPLGLTLVPDGAEVAVWSSSADRVWFCLFDGRGESETARHELVRDGEVHRAFVPGVAAGARYGLRAEGPFDPARGHRFDPAKLLVDPCAARLDRPFRYRPELAAPRDAGIDTAPLMPKAIVETPLPAADLLPPRPPGFVYELPVKAFTKRHPQVPESLRGTVAALARPAALDHFLRLGVDTVELMPVVAWIDERHLGPLGLSNAWGYNPVAFMAPDPRLAPGGLGEIRKTVAALHEAGLRVILDAVFNHTGESDQFGPTLSLRGLDAAVYFRHAADGSLINDTGTGNTLACHRLPVVRLVVDSMRHWILSTGIDGFRLDLAAVLGRGEDGGFEANAPLLAAIDADPLLKDRVIVAEPWDIGPGGYRLGGFPPRWHEWNDRYRDDVRRFWRGDRDALGGLATRLAGSADIFERPGRAPSASVNFLAAHDGFTLADLVAHAGKRNEANGEGNRDGTDENFSWNCGVEGHSGDPSVAAARRRDVAALLATLFVSRGTPMLTAGDEFGRSQRGNNNAYAQDNETTWLDWAAADLPLAEFVGRLVRTRKRHPALSADRFLTGRAPEGTGVPDVAWLRPDGLPMRDADWAGEAHVLGMQLCAEGAVALVWINGAPGDVEATLPPAGDGRTWVLLADSADPEAGSGAGLGAGPVLLPPRCVRIYSAIEA